jgi:hypothetical protein
VGPLRVCHGTHRQDARCKSKCEACALDNAVHGQPLMLDTILHSESHNSTNATYDLPVPVVTVRGPPHHSVAHSYLRHAKCTAQSLRLLGLTLLQLGAFESSHFYACLDSLSVVVEDYVRGSLGNAMKAKQSKASISMLVNLKLVCDGQFMSWNSYQTCP